VVLFVIMVCVVGCGLQCGCLSIVQCKSGSAGDVGAICHPGL